MDVHRTGGRHTFPIMAPLYHRRHLSRLSFDLLIEDLNKVPVLVPHWRPTPAVLLVHHLFGTTAFQEASLPVAAVTWLMEWPLPRLYRNLPVQAVSRSTADDLVERGFDRSRIEVIENGVDLSFFAPDPQPQRFAEPTVLYLGRLARYKRVDIIIRAVARLRNAGLDVRLIIGGRGAAQAELQKLTAELAVADRVEFAGFVSARLGTRTDITEGGLGYQYHGGGRMRHDECCQ
jgi:glycosyltransferase involved in cell wall biosynthesis